MTFLALMLVAVAVLLVVAGVLDLRSRRIPNWIPLSIFILYLAFLATQYLFDLPVEPLRPLSSLATGAGVTLAFGALFALRYIGGGDAKLVAAMGFWAGAQGIAAFLLIMALTGGALALVYLGASRIGAKPANGAADAASKSERKNVKIPYGIAIALAGLFVVNNILTFLLA